MKLIDDNKYQKLADIAIDNIEKKPYTIKIGKLEVDIPKNITYKIVSLAKLWEADNVSDIIENYNQVNKTTTNIMLLPENMKILEKVWKDSIVSANLTYEDAREIERLIKEDDIVSKQINTELGWGRKVVNYNMIILENIYIGNCKLSETKQYNKWNLNIKDKNNNIIPGIVIYAKKPIAPKDLSLEESIDLATSYSDYTIPFDIIFQALPVYRIDTSQPQMPGAVVETVYKGQKLIIHSIDKTGGNKKTFNPVGSYMPKFA